MGMPNTANLKRSSSSFLRKSTKTKSESGGVSISPDKNSKIRKIWYQEFQGVRCNRMKWHCSRQGLSKIIDCQCMVTSNAGIGALYLIPMTFGTGFPFHGHGQLSLRIRYLGFLIRLEFVPNHLAKVLVRPTLLIVFSDICIYVHRFLDVMFST